MGRGTARPGIRRTIGATIVGLAMVVAVAGIAGCQLASTAASSFGDAAREGRPVATVGADGTVSEADGVLPSGATVFDERYPGIANLDSELLQALRDAARAAADDGVTFYVNSGWRSAEYQDRLLDQAVVEYGSEHEAARWVATATTSPHVHGDAADIGESAATAWLSEFGAAYGLCQVYRNEPWHYELRPEAPRSGCPRMYADPTHDPRMQQ